MNEIPNEGTVKGKRLRTLAILAAAVFLLSLVPVLYVSRYAHPLTDDYNFSYGVHLAFERGEGLPGIIKAACATVKENYFNWQGTFAAIFLFALQPGAFGDGGYFLTTFIMVGMLCLSTWMFVSRVLTENAGEKRPYAVLAASMALFLSIQLVPDKEQAFYWYNGSSYYTVFYALLLLAVTLAVGILRDGKDGIARWIALAALGVMTGGGNYSTALLGSELAVLATAALFIKKRKEKWGFLALTAVTVAAFAASVLAPGNAMRMLENTAIPPAEAILRSFKEGATLFMENTGFTQILYALALIPLFLGLTRGTERQFPRPVAVCLLAFALYCSLLTPPLYAMGYTGEGRNLDIYWYARLLLITFQVWYVCGRINAVKPVWAEKTAARIQALPKTAVRATMAAFALLCLGHVAANREKIGHMTSVSTGVAIVRGTAADYDRRYREILKAMASGEPEVTVHDLETRPPFFGKLYLEKDPSAWPNAQLAAYFGKERVLLAEDG